MKKADMSKEDSIKDNLKGYCFEVGSDYEKYSRQAAELFITHIGRKPVVDLGAGDGAGTRVFVEHGNPTTAVDINPVKLNRIKGATLVNEDFETFLTKPVDNIFFHHALEHYTEPEKVLAKIAKHLKPGSFCYIAVPKGDHVHSVHHVAFENIEEIMPPGLELIDAGETDEGEWLWPQYWTITKKV